MPSREPDPEVGRGRETSQSFRTGVDRPSSSQGVLHSGSGRGEARLSAAEAGVKEGDVILTIGKGAIGSYDDLVEAIFNLPAGQTVEMKVLRGLDELPLTITPRFAEVAEVR